MKTSCNKSLILKKSAPRAPAAVTQATARIDDVTATSTHLQRVNGLQELAAEVEGVGVRELLHVVT